jgi:hypothetical protein
MKGPKVGSGGRGERQLGWQGVAAVGGGSRTGTSERSLLCSLPLPLPLSLGSRSFACTLHALVTGVIS